MTDDRAIEARDFTSCQYGSQHEVVQEPSDHESHNESPYFNFLLGQEAGITGVIIRIGLRPNEGYSEASLVIPRRDGTVLFHYERSPLTRAEVPVGASRWQSGPMTFEVVEPTRRWRLSYASDDSRLVTDPYLFGQKPGEAWRASEPQRCEFEVDWEADFPIHVLSPSGHELPGDMDGEYGKDHYEQFGRVNGAIRIGDEEWKLEAVPAVRDHSWGPRIWEKHPTSEWVSVYLDDGRRIVAFATTEDAHGVIWKPGSTTPIPIERYELETDYIGGPAAPKRVAWRFQGGSEDITVEGKVSGFMPLRVGRTAVRLGQTVLDLVGDTPGRAKVDLGRPLLDA